MRRIEALVDAIAYYNGAHTPDSQVYYARNPLALKEFKGHVNTGKLRRFGNWTNGYRAALHDVHIKCSGLSNAKLDDKFDLSGLMRVYCLPDLSAKYVAKYLRKALQDDSITETTALAYFVENDNG